MRFFAGMSRALRFRPPALPRQRRRLERLELHVTHACNLTCDSCCHYSNHGHRGNLDLAQADRWMKTWSDRFTVDEFNLLGGEPTIHPRLPEFVTMVRRHWPAARIRVITNGFFLHRHPDLPSILAAVGNSDLTLSVHYDGAGYGERLRPIHDLVASWQREHGIVVQTLQSHEGWTRRYLGFGEEMLPFEDGLPRQSWEICPARTCKQLHDGKIWKCAPLAYLPLQKAKYALSGKWDRYLEYKPLEETCTDREMDEFLAREDEAACAMCSAVRRPYVLPNPLRNAAKAVVPDMSRPV